MPEYRLTKLRGQWAVAAYEGGRRTHRYATGTADRKAAERVLDEHRRKFSTPAEITVAYLWEQYREEHADKRIAGNMVYSGKAILPTFGHLAPEEVTTTKVRSYIAARRKLGRQDGTIWTELNHLQIALNWAAKKRLIPHPVSVDRPTKPPPRDRRLTRPEVRRLLEAAEYPHVRLAIALMAGTAARIGAILDLTWDRVDFERGLIDYANPVDKKRRKGRATVPIAPDLLPRLQEARRAANSEFVVEWAARQVGSIKRGFARAVARAGLKDVTPHVLRHTAASLMAEKGVPMTEIAAVLGHSDSRVTERVYAKFSPTYLRGAIAHLDMSGVPSVSRGTENENEP